MTDDARLVAELTERLESLRLVEARGSSSEMAQEQLDALLARLEAVTSVLRRHPPAAMSPETERLVARLALGDLAAVAASLRAAVQELGAALDRHATAAEDAYTRAAELDGA